MGVDKKNLGQKRRESLYMPQDLSTSYETNLISIKE